MMNLDDPVATALRVANLLERDETAYGLYGGLAVAAWGVPRETKDAGLAVVSCDVAHLADLLSHDGLDVRTAFSRVRFGGLFVSRVSLLGGEDASGLNTVDLVEPASILRGDVGPRPPMTDNAGLTGAAIIWRAVACRLTNRRLPAAILKFHRSPPYR